MLQSAKQGKDLALSLCWGQDGENKVVMCFLVTALVEVWPKKEGDCLFLVVGLGKLVNVEIFLRHNFYSAECLL